MKKILALGLTLVVLLCGCSNTAKDGSNLHIFETSAAEERYLKRTTCYTYDGDEIVSGTQYEYRFDGQKISEKIYYQGEFIVGTIFGYDKNGMVSSVLIGDGADCPGEYEMMVYMQDGQYISRVVNFPEDAVAFPFYVYDSDYSLVSINYGDEALEHTVTTEKYDSKGNLVESANISWSFITRNSYEDDKLIKAETYSEGELLYSTEYKYDDLFYSEIKSVTKEGTEYATIEKQDDFTYKVMWASGTYATYILDDFGNIILVYSYNEEGALWQKTVNEWEIK